MQTVIRAAEAAEFLALIPALAGYRPSESLALVLFRGSRTAGIMRLDLIDPASSELDAYASTAVGLACKAPDVDGIALLVYTGDPFRDSSHGSAIAYSAVIHALELRAHACGLRIVDALCVAADAWGSYLDSDIPPIGRPLDEIRAREESVAVPSPSEDQASGARLPEVDFATRERVGQALQALAEAAHVVLHATPDRTPSCGTGRSHRGEDERDATWDKRGVADLDPRALAAVCAMDDLPALLEELLDRPPSSLDPFGTAVLGWCLSRPALRDVAITQWVDGVAAGGVAMAAQLDWEGGAEYPVEVARRFWGEGPRPDAARLMRGRDLACHVAAAVPRTMRPGPLAAAAWLCWALGRSSHAAWYAGQALEIEPGHGLSQIVLGMVGAAHLPEWAFERPRTT